MPEYLSVESVESGARALATARFRNVGALVESESGPY